MVNEHKIKSFPPVPRLPQDIAEEFDKLQQKGFNYAEWVRERFRVDFLGKESLLRQKEEQEKKLEEINKRLEFLDTLKVPDISPEASLFLYLKVKSNAINSTNISGQLEFYNRSFPNDTLVMNQFKDVINTIRENILK